MAQSKNKPTVEECKKTQIVNFELRSMLETLNACLHDMNMRLEIMVSKNNNQPIRQPNSPHMGEELNVALEGPNRSYAQPNDLMLNHVLNPISNFMLNPLGEPLNQFGGKAQIDTLMELKITLGMDGSLIDHMHQYHE